MQGQANHFNLYAPEKMCVLLLLHLDIHSPVTSHSPYAINRYLNETKRLYGVLETQLQGKEFVLGTYGIADIKIFGWARYATRTGLSLDDFPNIKAWVERIEARPAVKAGIATSTPPSS